MNLTKWEFKAFLICESSTEYCLKNNFYTGPCNQSLSLKFMFRICIWVRNQNYHTYMDNFFTSFELFEQFQY